MKKLKEEKGQALIEFALIIPVLILLLFGMLDFGLLTITKFKAQTATYESARYAATYTGSSLESDLADFVSRSLNGATVYYGTPAEESQVPPNTAYINSCTVTETEVDITITYYATCTTFISQIFAGGKAYPLHSQSIVVVIPQSVSAPNE